LYLFNASGEQLYDQSVTNAVQAVSNTGHIGEDGNDAAFIGTIDEVAVYNYSLNQQQLTNLWNVGVSGQLPPSPPLSVMVNITESAGGLNVSWNPVVGTLLQANSLAGPWTAVTTTSPYIIAPSQTQSYYRVKIQ
ncbi:MAG: hypothetical protein ABSE48_12540, partial [Verrucomicrobiota bacterium]